MTEYTHRVLIIIPAASRDAANAAAVQLTANTADAFTFTVGLSPNGVEPITHYWCSVALREADYQAVQQMKAAFTGSEVIDWNMDHEPTKPDEVLASLGLMRLEARALGA